MYKLSEPSLGAARHFVEVLTSLMLPTWYKPGVQQSTCLAYMTIPLQSARHTPLITHQSAALSGLLDTLSEVTRRACVRCPCFAVIMGIFNWFAKCAARKAFALCDSNGNGRLEIAEVSSQLSPREFCMVRLLRQEIHE